MAIVSLGIVAAPSLAKLGLIHMMPMGLYEIGLAFWLLIKGIRPPDGSNNETPTRPNK